MFTGIIEELGKIRNITSNNIEIDCKTVQNDIKIGDSISVNGVCLTVCKYDKNGFTADISQETLKVTSLNELSAGDYVNIERAMPANGRFGGHIVSGHVDSKGKCTAINKTGNFYNIEFELPPECIKYTVLKGSITINGISLTIAAINKNRITIAVIPHTFENTNLQYLKNGQFVNIEVDMFAKYIENFLSTGDNKTEINLSFLQENGYT